MAEPMQASSRMYVAGHAGLVGAGLCRALTGRGCRNLLLRTHGELDLTDQSATDAFFRLERPEYVFLAAGLAGGIHRNRTSPAQMIRTNLAIQTNVIQAAWEYRVRKLLFIGSACCYPKHCPQPIGPDALLTGPLEPTNEPFALAKLAGMAMCRAYNVQYGTRFLSVIPCTLYGPGDHFDENGHVVAALLGRFHAAKLTGQPQVTVWGTGRPRREFLYVDDFAEAAVRLMDCHDDGEPVNIGSSQDISILELANLIRRTVGYAGELAFDPSKPDGMPQRLLDSSRILQIGWCPKTPLPEGLARTYQWFLQQGAGGQARPLA